MGSESESTVASTGAGVGAGSEESEPSSGGVLGTVLDAVPLL
ncbi:hypothetical protein [Tsukamurella sp. PLM1]|nr:hypothetical protein [Tsukamurella sp. PLM1]